MFCESTETQKRPRWTDLPSADLDFQGSTERDNCSHILENYGRIPTVQAMAPFLFFPFSFHAALVIRSLFCLLRTFCGVRVRQLASPLTIVFKHFFLILHGPVCVLPLWVLSGSCGSSFVPHCFLYSSVRLCIHVRSCKPLMSI